MHDTSQTLRAKEPPWQYTPQSNELQPLHITHDSGFSMLPIINSLAPHILIYSLHKYSQANACWA